MPRKQFSLTSLLIIFALLLAACGGGETTPGGVGTGDTGGAAVTTPEPVGEVTPEPMEEVTPEPMEEVTPEPMEEATPDAAEEATPDATEEATPDATEEATPDAAEEATPDATGTGGGPTDYAQIGDELAAAFEGEYSGTSVSLSHGLSGDEEARFENQFREFEEATGIDVNLIPGNTVETTAVKVESGTIEDIVNFPQPGTMAGYARQGRLVDLNTIINQDWLTQNYNQGFLDTNTVDDGSGNQILGGIFNRINFKSAVWYPKQDFEDAGYEIPETWDEMQQLMDDIVADGDTPWCIGIESAGASGWPATDWIEDIMLRTTSLENYDRWTTGELEFTSPEVRNAFEILTNIWFNDQYVYGGRQAIATTNFGDAPTPMLQQPPNCWLHRQGNFITSFFEQNVPGVEYGVDYDFFYLPPIDEQYGRPVLYAGDLFSVFNDRPEVRAVIQYLTTYESVRGWVTTGPGALSPHRDVNLDDYSPLERRLAETLGEATSVRFDGSDLMPAEVGSGSFWKGVTDYVSGSANLDQALETMQSGWANVQR
jgi:alpha-glucoside transport system substrate-binding protein